MPNLSRFRQLTQSRDGIDNDERPESVLVVGLGRFGTAIASTLVNLGVDVMAVETDQDLVNLWADRLTHVRLADATHTATLKQLGAASFDAAVVAIGSDLESSILTTAALTDVGVKIIWAKALTEEHGKILERVGAHHVVYPERQMGERVAHVVTGRVEDYYLVDEGFVLAEIEVPSELVGIPLNESDLREGFNVSVVCVKHGSGSFSHAAADTVLNAGDFLVVAGLVEDAERFVAFATGRTRS